MQHHVIKSCLLVFLSFVSQICFALTSLDQCRSFTAKESQNIPELFVDALLWQVQKQGIADSYVYGTIHVSDPRVLDLPRPVQNALNISNTFVMELVPNDNDINTIKDMMFYSDNRRLSDLLDEPLFKASANILQQYYYSQERISTMKPWAAYLTMNYPSDRGIYLDLLLMNLAEQQQMQIHGIETLEEQLSIFSTMKETDQLQILLDTVCNYDDVKTGFDIMVTHYLNRDLKGLFRFNSNTTMFDEPLYKNMIFKVLTNRNRIMAERVSPILQRGNAFIAIGAMHLSGEGGLLSLLKKQGYDINPLY